MTIFSWDMAFSATASGRGGWGTGCQGNGAGCTTDQTEKLTSTLLCFPFFLSPLECEMDYIDAYWGERLPEHFE